MRFAGVGDCVGEMGTTGKDLTKITVDLSLIEM
jgi:hypothetical protein